MIVAFFMDQNNVNKKKITTSANSSFLKSEKKEIQNKSDDDIQEQEVSLNNSDDIKVIPIQRKTDKISSELQEKGTDLYSNLKIIN